MGNEIRTQIGAITKSSHDDNGGDAFRLENEVYPPRPPRDESRADASGERAEQTGHGIPSRDARIAALVKKIDGYKRAEVEAKQELKRTKENVAKRLEVKLQEYKEKTQVDLLHYKNSLDLIKRTHEEELKTVGEEVIQVKKDARLIIDFIRRKANEAIADGASKNAEQKKKMTESLEFQELQMKKSFSAHLEKFEEQVKNVVRGEKIAFQTEMTHTPTTKMNLRMSRIPKSPTRDISLVPKNPIVEEIFSDDSISMEDTITNAVQDAKYNHSTDDNSKMLKSRIELLEQWTDTLTIALRSGAAIKGLTEDSSPPCDEISWGNKDAGEGRAFVPRYVKFVLFVSIVRKEKYMMIRSHTTCLVHNKHLYNNSGPHEIFIIDAMMILKHLVAYSGLFRPLLPLDL